MNLKSSFHINEKVMYDEYQNSEESILSEHEPENISVMKEQAMDNDQMELKKLKKEYFINSDTFMPSNVILLY